MNQRFNIWRKMRRDSNCKSVANRPKIGIAIKTKEVKAWRTVLEVGVLTWLKRTGARGDR